MSMMALTRLFTLCLSYMLITVISVVHLNTSSMATGAIYLDHGVVVTLGLVGWRAWAVQASVGASASQPLRAIDSLSSQQPRAINHEGKKIPIPARVT